MLARRARASSVSSERRVLNETNPSTKLTVFDSSVTNLETRESRNIALRPTTAPPCMYQYLDLVLPSTIALSNGNRPVGLPLESKSPESGASTIRQESTLSERKSATVSTHRPKFTCLT